MPMEHRQSARVDPAVLLVLLLVWCCYSGAAAAARVVVALPRIRERDVDTVVAGVPWNWGHWFQCLVP